MRLTLHTRAGIGASLAIACGALVWWRWGWSASQFGALRFGNSLIAAGRGKITDPASFLYFRTWELLLIVAAAAVIVFGTRILNRWLLRWAEYREGGGIGAGVLCFVALNCWLACARHTALFWLLLFDPRAVDNVTQYEIKKHMLAEHHAPTRAVLLGNSQTRAAIREETLNSLLAPGVWTTELHQPGSKGFDTYLIVDDLRNQPFDVAIVYVSEIFLHGRDSGGVIASFLKFQNLPELTALKGWHHLRPEPLRDGLAGAIFPTYRLNPTISQRILGNFIANLPQKRFDEVRAEVGSDPKSSVLAALRASEAAEFQKRGMESAIRELAERHQQLVLIAGSVNSKLGGPEDAALIVDLQQWLQGLRNRWPNTVTVVSETDFFVPRPEDFKDMLHFTDEAQLRFTESMAAYFKERQLLVHRPGRGPLFPVEAPPSRDF